MLRFGRYRACRAGLSAEQLSAHKKRLETHGFIRLRDTVYKSWAEMYRAVDADVWRYNDSMLDDPALPEVVKGQVKLKKYLT